jgi:nucleotidyltransferase substrate binding protein (TIGR01987 family)
MKPPEHETFERLEAALARLNEAMELPALEGVNLDGTIQRFEFTFELAWKCAKRALIIKGVDARSPRDVIKECYAMGWINDEPGWVAMLKDRNLTSHTYHEQLALEIRERLPGHVFLLNELAQRIKMVLDAGA